MSVLVTNLPPFPDCPYTNYLVDRSSRGDSSIILLYCMQDASVITYGGGTNMFVYQFYEGSWVLLRTGYYSFDVYSYDHSRILYCNFDYLSSRAFNRVPLMASDYRTNEKYYSLAATSSIDTSEGLPTIGAALTSGNMYHIYGEVTKIIPIIFPAIILLIGFRKACTFLSKCVRGA
jgi:hypothetical protein